MVGIYQIINKENGKMYIGQSINLSKRKWTHFWKLERNIHYNKYLQSSYNKHGKDKFCFSILLYCEPSELTYYEQGLVDNFNPEYNLRKECVNSPKGMKCSEETKHKLSLAHKLRWVDKAHMSGYKLSEETRQKMSVAALGRGFVARHPQSEETKKKISLATIGKHNNIRPPVSKETKIKMSKAQKGKPKTDCTRQKMSNGMKEVWRKRKQLKLELI